MTERGRGEERGEERIGEVRERDRERGKDTGRETDGQTDLLPTASLSHESCDSQDEGCSAIHMPWNSRR